MNALQPVAFKHVLVHDPRVSPKYVPGKHSRRFWTEAEDLVIRTWFPEGDAASCMVHLTDRGSGAIYQRAKVLGVKSTQIGVPKVSRVLASPRWTPASARNGHCSTARRRARSRVLRRVSASPATS